MRDGEREHLVYFFFVNGGNGRETLKGHQCSGLQVQKLDSQVESPGCP